jgi:hypothetical protein
MSLFTLTINNLSPALEHKSGEVAVIANALHAAATAVQAAQGNLTSGNLTIPHAGGVGDPVTIGSWAYVAQGSLP